MSLFQPFDPDEGNGRKRLRQLPQVPVRSVLPSLVTLVALCAGLTSIRMTIEGRFELAIALIAIAAALDGIDGRIARLLRSTSRFGAELDSIADFVNFGVAPAILIYVWGLEEMHSLGWIAVLVFAICAALRLARFNVALDSPGKPDWHAAYFFGVPAPAGAMLVMLPLYVEFVAVPRGFLTAPATFVYTIAVGLLMTSRLPTWSGKLVGRRIARDMVVPLFVCGVLITAFLVSYPWETLMVGAIAYLGSLPFSWAAFNRRDRVVGAPTPADKSELR
ncbi:MAG: CDP-diacylglycerol--serine O-phosphatidyltransferase [Bauldia sp.]|nr:CDP-diacylglycerol--serine O-phosphatidyltransferase [Bauldia sp.]